MNDPIVITSLPELSRQAMKIASDLYLKNGSFPPFWLIQQPGNGQIHMVVTPYYASDMSKRIYMASVKRMIAIVKADRFATAAESYVLDGKPAVEADQAQLARDGVRSHPDAFEAVSVTAESRAGATGTSIRRILKATEPRALGEPSEGFSEAGGKGMLGGAYGRMFEEGKLQ